MKVIILFLLLSLAVLAPQSHAELTLLAEQVLTESESPFSRRVYSYDFAVSDFGQVHAVYSKPVPGEDRARIMYVTKQVGADWPAEIDHLVLEEHGPVDSVSTWVLLDAQGIAHVSYLVKRDFVDERGYTHSSGLVHQTIEQGVASAKTNVASGAFHTRMQLNAAGEPIFAREYEVFQDENGRFLSPPYARALRLLLPQNGSWVGKVLSLPYPAQSNLTRTECLNDAKSCHYRLANFIYDSQRNRFHLAYGDGNANALRAAYPTSNPPATSGVYFPPGSGHKLWYAYSDTVLDASGNINGSSSWNISVIDNSGNLSENEFWTDLVLDTNGDPYAASYRYATDSSGVHHGSSAIFARFVEGAWQERTVAGTSTGAALHRAGMGPKILIDAQGQFHGIWDNSPDKPIDSISPLGTTMYRYSPDGVDWRTRQVVLPHSVEGFNRAALYDDKLLLMVLGDARSPRLTFAEYQMPRAGDNLFEIQTDKMFYGPGEAIQIHARLQGQGNGDIYVIAAGPYNEATDGSLIPVSSTFSFRSLGADLGWRTIDVANLAATPPTLANIPLSGFHGDLFSLTAGTSIPFANPARYVVYSVINQAGAPLGQLTSPLHAYQLHVCTQTNCGEL
jgi:hypothetical protein